MVVVKGCIGPLPPPNYSQTRGSHYMQWKRACRTLPATLPAANHNGAVILLAKPGSPRDSGEKGQVAART